MRFAHRVEMKGSLLQGSTWVMLRNWSVMTDGWTSRLLLPTITSSASGRGLVVSALAGYALVLLPSADLAQRLSGAGVDVRSEGSGNPGATNVDKLLGHRWGATVLAADVAKGALAARAGALLGGELGANVAGTSAVVGHCFRGFGKARGGKGVATRYGQLMVTDPL